ncbi:MAG TPA: orotidine-5'-phosphate decarboxylase [Thermomicrobiales bacterium]|nr:orotidine-5'-phosphate decarboxylase [Thermomicrobiales bacterium]
MSESHAPDTLSTFCARLEHRAADADSLLCIGLDPAIGWMPEGISDDADGVIEFCERLITATSDFVVAYKPNLAFFLAYGADGLDALYTVRDMIPAEIPVILDCKIGDIGSTASAYATAWLDTLDVDAITVHPYLGEDSLEPFLSRTDKGVFVLAKTSNPGSGDLQDKTLAETGEPLYRYVARRVASWADIYPATVGLVVGATWPEQLREIRGVAPDLPILLPGLGTQGGDLKASLLAGLLDNGTGVLCSASRGIIYASSGTDFAEVARSAAEQLRDAVNAVRRQPA